MTAQTTEATLSNTKQMLASLQDERDGVTLYSALADLEKSPQMAEVYRRLAAVEGRHAERWQAQLTAAGVTLPPYQPSWRTRMLVWLAQRFGVGFVLPTIASREQIDAGKYQSIAGAADMSGDEISHARLLGQVTQSLPGGLEGSAIAQMEGRHKAGGGNALRAAVLGANDGLVSNMSLVMGVAGASLANNQILVTGLAGLLAGACSMALGEWLSVQSSRELYEKQIAIERAEIEADPQEEAEELALIYQSRGIEEAQALELAQRIVGDQKNALDTLARGTGHRSRRTGRLGLGGSHHLVPALLGRGHHSCAAVYVYERHDGGARQPRIEHDRPVCDRRRHHPLYRPRAALFRRPTGSVWFGGRRHHLWHRPPDRG